MSYDATVTLSEAKRLIRALADRQSLLLLSAPGVGKSDVVRQAATEAGLECRSLLGTQIAPEDVSGIPQIVGERSVFCPPRTLLPDDGKPFCLFLDELPATNPDVQKAFYSLLLERRVGEFPLPPGTWVVAAGNRAEDRALVRSMSSALVNRAAVLHVAVDRKEWLAWGRANGVRPEILSFVAFFPEALMRQVPADPRPFSTPRAWASLSRALDRMEQGGALTGATRRAVVFGRVSAEDAALFCALAETLPEGLYSIEEYLEDPGRLPTDATGKWLVVHQVRKRVADGTLVGIPPETIDRFLREIPAEFCFAAMVDLVPQWAALGASPAMLEALRDLTGL